MSSIEGVVREIVHDELTYGGVRPISDLSERLEALEDRVNALFAHLEAVHAQLRALRAAESDDDAEHDDHPGIVGAERLEASERLERVRARNARAEAALATSSYNILSIDAAHEAVVDLCVDLIMYLPEYRRVMALDSIRMHVNAGDSESL